jgi:hypothetical protein
VTAAVDPEVAVDKVAVMPEALRYFAKVRLKNRVSGEYLAATNDNYTEAWSAIDQTAVVLHPAKDDGDLDWFVRPPYGMDFIKAVGEEIKLGSNPVPTAENIIRLYNKKYQRFLHSHNRAAPWAPQSDDKHEVTLFTGNTGQGDENDNWNISAVMAPKGPPGIQIRLRHVSTEGFLAGDGSQQLKLKSGLLAKAVWTENEYAQDSDWIVEIQHDLTDILEPEPLARYESQGQAVVLRSLAEARAWIADIKSLYDPIIAYGRNHRFFADFSQHLQALVAPLERYLNDLDNVDNVESYGSFVGIFRDTVTQIFIAKRLPDPNTPVAHFIKRLFKDDPDEGTYALIQTMEGNIEGPDGKAISAITKLTLFRLNGPDDPKPDWTNTYGAMETMRRELEAKLATSNTQLDTIVTTSQNQLERSKDGQARLLKATRLDFEKLRESFRGQEISDSPGEYWKQKRKRHRRNVTVLSWAFGASLLVIGVLLCVTFFYVLPKMRDPSAPALDYFVHVTLPIAAVASLVVWGIKTISRNLISQIHLAADADERETMLLTFRALLQDKDKPLSEEEKKVIVSIAFRPGGNGLGDESSGPTFLWEAFLKGK